MINISYKDSRPIYQQIKDGLRRLIVTGVLPPGEKLPSVRELASQLAANPNTIMRAYQELEADGYIYSVAGKGSFAAEKANVSNSRKPQLIEIFKSAADELYYLGVSVQELIEIINGIFNNRGGEENDYC